MLEDGGKEGCGSVTPHVQQPSAESLQRKFRGKTEFECQVRGWGQVRGVGHLDGARFEWKVLFAGEGEVSAQTLRQNMNEAVRVV